MLKSISTKYGNAKINGSGHYQIKSRKEGNHGKLLHRLIYEDFYKVTLLPYADVHHINGIKTDNHIENLELMSHGKHTSLHCRGENHYQYGVPRSEETKLKISLGNKGKIMSEETKLKISKAHKGKVLSEDHKKKLSDAHKGIKHTKQSKINMSKAHNKTGFYKVDINHNNNVSQGFVFRYRYLKPDGKESFLSSISLINLKDKVLKKGLDWLILDADNAKITLELAGLSLEDVT